MTDEREHQQTSRDVKELKGEALASRIRLEIERCGLTDSVTAIYTPSRDAITIGVPVGELLESGLDYPARPEIVAGIIMDLRVRAMWKREQWRIAVCGRPEIKLAA